MNAWRTALAALLMVFGFSGFGQESQKLKVVTSFFPVYSFVANVAGDLATVENLLPANTGPHDYQPTRSDLQKLGAADIVFINGLGLENWLQKLLRSARSTPGQVVVEITQGIPERDLLHDEDVLVLGKNEKKKHDHSHGDHANPHVWLDPVLMRHAVTNILTTLQEKDPSNAEGYQKNADAYLQRLDALHREIADGLAPFKNSPVVTYHNFFPYFTRRYELKLVGVIEEVPDVRPSARYLTRLMSSIREQKVEVLFSEPRASGKMARQLAQDLKLKLAMLDPLERGPFTRTAYEDGMRQNLEALRNALSK